MHMLIIRDIDQSDFVTTCAVSVSFGLWSLLYFFTRVLFRDKTPEFASRVITLIHGTILTVFGVHHCFVGDWTFREPYNVTTDAESFMILVSLGYFIQDLIWCLWYQTETILMMLHHMYSCIALTKILFDQLIGAQTCCVLGIMESTNPLLQLRWFIRYAGRKESGMFSFVETMFIIMFFVMRICVGSVIGYLIVLNNKYTVDYRVFTLLIYAMSWLFMIQIIRYFFSKRKVSRPQRPARPPPEPEPEEKEQETQEPEPEPEKPEKPRSRKPIEYRDQPFE